jgi:uncharacterized glyoxalase superfamily protein PhnB
MSTTNLAEQPIRETVQVRPAIIPCFVYDNAPAAIDFLCAAFGFERHLVATGETPSDILHAQLTLDGNMIMLSTGRPTTRERFGMVAPGSTNGLVTSCTCVTVADPDAHYAKAKKAGAGIVMEPHDNPYGGRGYEARDPEGNVWSFSNYDPWAA